MHVALLHSNLVNLMKISKSCSKVIQKTLRSDKHWLRYSLFSVISRVKWKRDPISKNQWSWMNSRYNPILQVGKLAALQFNQMYGVNWRSEKVESKWWQGFCDQKFAFQITLRNRQFDGNTLAPILPDFWFLKLLCSNPLKSGRMLKLLKSWIIKP